MWNQALSIATAIVAASSAAIYVILALGRKDTALWLVTASFLTSAAAFALFIGQGSVTPWISVVLANVILYIAHLLLGSGFRIFSGAKKIWPARFYAYEIAALSFATLFQFIHKSYELRVLASSGMIAVCGIEYLIAVAGRESKISGRNKKIVGTFVVIFICFHLSRIGLTFAVHTGATALMDRNGVSTYTFLMSIAIFISWVGSVMILDSSKLLSEMESKNAMLEILALHDKLTGLFNRNTLENTIHKEMERQDRYHTPLALVMLDIDHFKRVNDLYGHDNGDKILVEIAQRVHGAIRETDMLFRWGGEEFLILSPNTNDAGAGLLAEKLRREIMAAPIPPAGTVTASFGVAERLDGETRDQWFHRVDQAMYRAKRSGRNRVEIWNRAHQQAFTHFTITWQKAWESGNLTIDREHRELIWLGNDLINHIVSKDDLGATERLLDELITHIREHFRDEETILEKAGYGELETHREIHRNLFAEAERIRERFAESPDDPIPLFNLLVNKIIMDHMLSTDVKFYDCIAAYREEERKAQ